MRASAALLLAVALLAGCADVPRAGTGAAVPQGYLHFGPINLAVRSVEIDRGGPALTSDGRPLAEEAFLWAADRLQATGRSGIARFVVRRAEIRERPYAVPNARGEDRMVTRALRYEARIEAEIQFLTDTGQPQGVAVARGGSLAILAEDANAAEQDRALVRLVSQSIAAMNQEFDRALARR